MSGTSGWASGQTSGFNGQVHMSAVGPGRHLLCLRLACLTVLIIGQQMNMDEGKLSISIDFGTTFSGVAYGSSRIAGGKVQQILHWPGSFETFRKIPTCLLYDDQGQVLAWGLEAKNANVMQGGYKCEW